MAKIRVLDDRLINKIAAGEVVERPASALKELLENALDAGASELRVDLELGGKSLIRVLDDGEGMDADDLLLALERHATSKISSFGDLEQVATLGFRGEALPSIAAVSRMTIRSRLRGAPEGRELTAEGGVIRGVKPCAMAPGTAVEVRGIFRNVPARRKFMRSNATEYAHCLNAVTNYALAFPERSVMLRHNGADVIAAPPAGSLRERLAQLLGPDLLERLLPLEGRDGEMLVVGFAGEPSLHRANASMLHFFVNRRAVRDRVLVSAVRAAYEDLLPKRRTPAAYLFIELPAREVDVNVHPSKTEVRFRRADRVHRLVVGAVRGALSAAKPLAALAPEPRTPKEAAPRPGKPAATLESLDAALRSDTDGVERRIDFRELRGTRPLSGREVATGGGGGRRGESRAGPPAPERFTAQPPDPAAAQVRRDEPPASSRPQRFRVEQIDPERVVPLGQVGGSYVVAGFEGGLMLVDQHAAHERVLFEELMGSAAGTPPSQGLIRPLVVELPPTQVKLLEEHAGLLRSLGFDVEPFGRGGAALRAVPASLADADAEDLIARMAADLEDFGGTDRDGLLKELVVSAACHGAIKVNTPLSEEKMHWLLEELFRCEMPMRCPHGRPVVLTIGADELRRRFGRS